MKKMIMFIIDSLHPVVLERTLSEGNAPTLNFLIQYGRYWNEIVSSFPTMTPVATSSIMTGHGPDKHGVPGFIWYQQEANSIVDYGATWQSVMKLGTERIIRGLLQKLNQQHLNPDLPTLHEKLEEQGYTTGNINFFIHRGKNKHIAKAPCSVAVTSGFKLMREDVWGPELLTLGEFTPSALGQSPLKYPRGMFHRFGFNDLFSIQAAVRIIREGKQPDFLLVYLPDNDKYSHWYGPLRTGHSLERADRLIGMVMDALGSWEQALDENVIIVTGDHSQTTVGLSHEYRIDLDRALRSFQRVKLTEKADMTKEIAICPNERMAFVYILQREEEILPKVVEVLKRDGRNTQIAWRVEAGEYCVIQGGTEKRLLFSPEGPYHDSYGQTWNLDGELAVIDARVGSEYELVYGQYPDALARLVSALESRPGTRVAVSAAAGYEYLGEGAPIHPGGGSHGSLEYEDSVVPLIVSGTAQELTNTRITDLYTFVLEHFAPKPSLEL